jgi:hypothetical protein
MKNRMRESRSFGSVRGEGGDVLAYSESQLCSVVLRRANVQRAPLGKLLNLQVTLSQLTRS